MEASAQKAPGAGKKSSRTRSERKLAWMLCAPAVIAMLARHRLPDRLRGLSSPSRSFDLRFPDRPNSSASKTTARSSAPNCWWTDFFNTLLIVVISVGIELVLGMALALVMHRAIFGRGVVRTSVLIPYGIITVVAAFAWQFAFAPEPGSSTTSPRLRE